MQHLFLISTAIKAFENAEELSKVSYVSLHDRRYNYVNLERYYYGLCLQNLGQLVGNPEEDITFVEAINSAVVACHILCGIR